MDNEEHVKALDNLGLYSTPWDGDPSKDRDKFIGGSDVGTILGVNKFKSPYVLFLEKTGKIEPENVDDKLQVRLGHKMEQVVAEIYEEETGTKVQKSNRSYRSKKYPFLVGHIDRKLVGSKKGLEIKTTSSWNKTDYKEGEIPPSHFYQCMFYMMITGIHDWDIATLRDNNEFYVMHVSWNEEIASEILHECIEFWKCVESGVWDKPIDGSINTETAIGKAFPCNVDMIPQENLPVTIENRVDVIGSYFELVQSIKQLETTKKSVENELKAILGNNQVGFIGDEYKVTWIPKKRSAGIDIDKLKEDHPEINIEKYRKPQIEYREFKIAKIKKKEIKGE